MSFSNSDKAKHGQSAQRSLENILSECADMDYISNIKSDYRIGKDGFSNSKQFYAPFAISFKDGTKWIIFTTTSMRTDRIKGQQWDALNLKEIDKDITKAYLVYPDGINDDIKSEFVRQNKKYQENVEFSTIDAIVSQDTICNLIENYALKHKQSGQKKDIQGNNFETRIANILKNPTNLKKWLSNDALLEGMHFDIFKKILDIFALDKDSIKSIYATSDKKEIGKLPSGGNPKTDVLVIVTLKNKQEIFYTISCKRTSSDSVSVHQYNADSFSDVLDKNNSNLRKLLNEFQKYGNLRDFGIENGKLLSKELKPYLMKLTTWVLGGHGGSGTPKQKANYILTYSNNTSISSIQKIEDYCQKLLTDVKEGHFGTPFSWTYPSKRKGKDIQLKCKILD